MNVQQPVRSLLELATLGAALGSGLVAALGRILPPLLTLALLRHRALVGQSSGALLAVLTLAGCHGNELHSIAPPGSATPVARLSELGVFEGDLAQQQPRTGFVGYDVNVALYADSASKHRFVFVPEGTHVRTSADRWELPVGAYLVKTFGFPVDARDPALGERLIETRFLVKTADGFVASTYVWNDAQSDASVSAGDLDVPVSWIDERGHSHDETFHVPGTSDCASCHGGRALGWRSRQLDRAGAYPDGTNDQIAHLAARGVIDGPPPAHEVLSDPLGGAPLAARARSYLDANCGHCHGAGGSAADTGLYWDFEHTAPESLPLCRSFGLFGGPALVPGQPEESGLIQRMLATDSFSRMPRGPTRSADREGIALLSAWITSLTPAGCP